MVSIIELWKNYGYLLDVFECVWVQSLQVWLCIVGCIGWKCEVLVEWVWQYLELNKCLFMFNDFFDKSLEYVYFYVVLLVFLFYVEGFGLLLVEVMQCGLLVMGSDILVFCEIGGEFMVYFDFVDLQILVNLVICFEVMGEFLVE